MLGDINPQTVRVTSKVVVYPGRDHVVRVNIKRWQVSGATGRYVNVDVTDVTRAVLVLPHADPQIVFDSDDAPLVFTFGSGGNIDVDLSPYAMPQAVLRSWLILYDAEHTSGQVVVDDKDAELELDFRNVSTTGTEPPPWFTYVEEAPIDGVSYVRKDGDWVPGGSGAVASVNGQTGVVVLDTDDIAEGSTNLYSTPTRTRGTVLTGLSTLVTTAVTAADNILVAIGKLAGRLALKEQILTAGTNITIDRTDPEAPVISSTGSGGAVDSVNGQTGVVVLDADDVGAATDAEGFTATFGSTGLISGGQLSINGGDNTKFDVALCKAVFTDYSTPQAPVTTLVSFSAQMAVTVTNLALVNVSYIGVNSSGAIVQQTTRFTNTQRRSIVSLGAVVHSNRVNINAVNTIVSASRQLLNQFGDGIRAIGQLNLSGNVYGSVGATLQIARTAGELFAPGANFHVNPDDPHAISLASSSPVTFRYRLRDGTEFSNTTSVDPSNYDLAGVLTTVPNNKFTVQLIALFQSGITRLQYGQGAYTTISDAVAAAQAQSMVVEQNIAENGIIRGYLVLRKGVTDLTDTSQAIFIALSKFSAAAAVAPLSLATTDDLAEGAVNLYHRATNLTQGTRTATTVEVVSSTGADVTLSPVSTTEAGVMPAADRVKLDGIDPGANNYEHPNHSGDVTSVGDGAQTIAANAVSDTKLRDSAALSVIGRSANSTGDPADIVAGTDGHVLRRSGATLGFGTVATGGVADDAVTNAKLGNMAANTIKGRVTASTGDPEDLTAAQVRTIIGAREVLTAARTYYVRTDGSDSNDGLTDSAGGAFLTIQKAINVATGTLDAQTFQVTIQVKDGTYTGTNICPPMLGTLALIIKGNATTPANVHINVTGSAFSVTMSNAVLRVSDLKITATSIALSAAPGTILFNNIEFAAATARHLNAQFGGFINATAAYTITGGSVAHAQASHGSAIRLGGNITLTGTPNFSTAFVSVTDGLGVISTSSTPPTITGSATGKRYSVVLNGVINSFGSGANYFPGDVAGTTATGGQYA